MRLALVLLLSACADSRAIEADSGTARDAGNDAGSHDSGGFDAGSMDSGSIDLDSGSMDSGSMDSGPIGMDSGRADAGRDSGPRDSGPVTTGDCISGALGNRAVRFSWEGSGPGSTAYVNYEVNQLPDTVRWRVSAASMSIGYRPVYDDTFLGPGGLDLEGDVFMDIELSTSGLSSIRNVTISIFGRSFNTTASGSFSWQTFDDVGETPSGSIANSTPYEWYSGDATTAFSPGDTGVYLRLRPGPPSDALIVNRVEICFDAD